MFGIDVFHLRISRWPTSCRFSIAISRQRGGRYANRSQITNPEANSIGIACI
jgi:hypothetical protein